MDYYQKQSKAQEKEKKEKEKQIKLGTRKSKAFTVYSSAQLENLNDLKNPFKFMKNKIKLENMIEENKQDVFVDSLVQMKGYQKQLKYFDTLKNSARKQEKNQKASLSHTEERVFETVLKDQKLDYISKMKKLNN